MTVPYIIPIIALLVSAYFISHQEEKSKDNNQLKAYKKARPVLKFLAATQNINLSDEEIKQLHKTMNNAMKTMGGEYFKNKIAPKINKEINKAVSSMDAHSTENDITKLVMKTVNTQVKGILKKYKYNTLPGRESVSVSDIELYSPPPTRRGVKFTSSAKGSKRKKCKRTTKKSRRKNK